MGYPLKRCNCPGRILSHIQWNKNVRQNGAFAIFVVFFSPFSCATHALFSTFRVRVRGLPARRIRSE